MSKTIKVISRKYDGTLHRSWECRLISFDGEKLNAVGEFAKTVVHSHLGVIESGTRSFETFWLDRWYNVLRFETQDGNLRNYYANITLPPKFDGNSLDFIDLDLDVVYWPDGKIEVLDEQEFELNIARYHYSDAMIKTVRALALTLSNGLPASYHANCIRSV